MHLYHLTLQRPTGVIAAAYGSFSAPKVHEIALACGSSLEVIRPDENGKLQSAGRTDVFGQIRSIAAFRLTGAKRDYLIVGSDSGKVTIVQFNIDKYGHFDRVHCETFGKSGVRRIVPGEYTVVDPRGRACMLAAVEKQKFVYVLNRDSSEKLTISSPLEAHKSGVLCYHVAGLDVGFENPIFAALERPYEEPGAKVLVYYELDLGLNHAVRKQAVQVDDSAYHVCAVPGGGDGPSGALVCSLGKLSYVGLSKDHPVLVATLPHRKGEAADNIMIVASAVYKQKVAKQKGMFFFLLCTERGDLLKVELPNWQEDSVSEINIKYLDTLPYAASAMCVLRSGFLFVASEFGDHHFYQFRGLSDDNDPAGGFSTSAAADLDRASAAKFRSMLVFTPRQEPENLALVDVIQSLAPLLSWTVDDVCGDGQNQIVAACGRGTASSIRVLRRGFAVQEMAVSDLPATPTGVFTVKENRSDPYDQYIIVSFVNATLVLKIGETVEEVSQSGLNTDVETIAASLLGEDSLVQIHAGGVRLIRKNAAVTEWKPPTGDTILAAATNPNQVAAALSSGDLVYFELDAESGGLDEVEKLDGVFSAAVTNGTGGGGGGATASLKPCLGFASPGIGRGRGLFLAASDGVSNVARIIAIQQDGSLENVALQALPGPAESVAILDIGGAQPVLLVGTKTGVLLRLKMDSVSGQITEKRSRFVGKRAVRLRHVVLSGMDTCFALTAKPWIAHPQSWARTALSPLYCDPIDNASKFSSEHCPEGFVATHGSTLRILSLDEPEVIARAAIDDAAAGVVFNSVQAKLPRTVRRLLNAKLPGTQSAGLVVAVDADQRSLKTNTGPGANTGTAPAGKWASSLRLMSLLESDTSAAQGNQEEEEPNCAVTLQEIEFTEDECATAACVANFRDPYLINTVYVAVVVARNRVVDTTSPLDRRLKQQKPITAEIRLYKLNPEVRRLEFEHATPVESVCYALSDYHGRILAGVGATLRIYEFGRRQLLKKVEYRQAVPNAVCTLAAISDRIFVGDVQESVQLFQYKPSENRLMLLANDTVPRWMTAMCIVDYYSVFGADKFGNVFVLRLLPELSSSLENDATGGLLADVSTGAPHRLTVACCFHVGSLVHSVAKVGLGGVADEILIYGTTNGAIGALVPISVRSNVDLFQHLEIALREAAPPLCGRDHLSYRSYYYPVRNVVDGDLIEVYASLPYDTQSSLSSEVDRAPADVLRRIEDLRESIL